MNKTKTQLDEWIFVKYIKETLMAGWYWTLWMSKWLTVPPHHVRILFNGLFHHQDAVMQPPPKKKTQWEDDLYFAVKFARQKLLKY